MQKTALLATLLAVLPWCQAAPYPNTLAASSTGISYPLRRKVSEKSFFPSKNHSPPKRDGVPVTLANNNVDYLIDLEVGTPAQAITLSIDTGSSDVWTFSSSGCDSCQGGTYDPSSSTSSSSVSSLGSFQDAYFDGSSVTGYYVTDTVTIDSEVGTASFIAFLAVATTSVGFHDGVGILGIGFDALEDSSVKHSGFVDDLVRNGIITSNSYSVYLNGMSEDSGSIIFGGVDNTKWSGELVPLPIIPYTPGDSAPRLQVEWTSLTLTGYEGTAGFVSSLTDPGYSYPVTLDTGSTLTYLPVDMFNDIAGYFGATVQDGTYYVNCQHPQGYLTYGFGSGPAVTIEVPFSELVVDLGGDLCTFGLQPLATNEVVIGFGDTFLRSAYMYVDFDQNTISLAQSVWS